MSLFFSQRANSKLLCLLHSSAPRSKTTFIWFCCALPHAYSYLEPHIAHSHYNRKRQSGYSFLLWFSRYRCRRTNPVTFFFAQTLLASSLQRPVGSVGSVRNVGQYSDGLPYHSIQAIGNHCTPTKSPSLFFWPQCGASSTIENTMHY